MGEKTGPRPQPAATLLRPRDLPAKASLPRLRVEYGKDARLAYLGHLEVLQTMERSIRRARLPFSLGNGFARRMRVQYSQALPVGASSAGEYLDLRLSEELDPDEALARLRAATPRGLAPTRCGYVDASLPALEAWLTRSSWEAVALGASFSAGQLDDAIARLRERGTLTYLRGDREKRVDLGSCLVGWEVGESPDGVTLSLETRSGAAGALRPAVLVGAALGAAGLPSPLALRVRRTAQRAEAPDGALLDPFPCPRDVAEGSCARTPGRLEA